MASRSQPECAPKSATSGAEPSAAFTPGPWVVWSSIYEGMVAQVRSTDMHERPIAEVRKHRNGYRDALLMAAAPDLLAALQGMIRLSDMGIAESLLEPEENGNFAAYERAKRAIAKALGTSETQS